MSNPYKALLNTESYEPVHRLVAELSASVEENSRLIAGIAAVADAEFGPTEAEDPLRAHLDSKYKLLELENGEEEFAGVVNPRLRQLLTDNYKLGMLVRLKQQQNKELFAVYGEYEELITTTVVPALAAETANYNLAKLDELHRRYLSEKIPADEKVWRKYQCYVDNLERIRRSVQVLMGVMETLDDKHTVRLREQLMAVEQLVQVARSGELKRTG